MASVAAELVSLTEGLLEVGAAPFRPQVECEVLDIWIELRREIQERLQDVPSPDGSRVSGVRPIGIDKRIATLGVRPCRFV